MARRKADTVHVPSDRTEAESMTADFIGNERKIMKARLEAQLVIDVAKADLAAKLAAIQAEQKGLFAGLKAWWEAGGASTVAGKNRSGDLAGAQIGIRKPPPSLKLPRGLTAVDLVGWIGSLRLAGKARYLRTPKTQLDKPALIKDLREQGPLAERLTEKGVTIDQTDEFFIDAGLDEEEVKKEIAAS